MKFPITALLLATVASQAFAAGHGITPMVTASDQSVENGIVSAEMVAAGENGWLVVHRTGADMAPGPVVGHAPLRAGENIDVAAILTEAVMPGDMLMLMVHAESGGMSTGTFEYTLGAKEDGPVRVDGELVMTVITVQ
ncbi:hypothetical protein EU803_15345 [Loktanella sp. IMCC34160]|uniref:DUF7282 domain-containing protein n=1 Tax=Loktanella sp. IMCC34160 TaxID=2510646 RepID=UPI00101BA03C|nr:hypothetical protein [Loktanella sp. IMCC34160]RYG89990.1 hypothetical protein EU803_15345 [Loktanella sp. IMCC34160]